MLHADTGIVHTKHQVCGIILKHHLADGDDDFAAACELYGVRQEVDDDLADAQLVALYAVDGHVLKVDLVVDAALLKLLCEHIVQAVAQLAQAERFFLKLDLAGLDARHLQNVVDERKQVVGKLVRLVEVLERFAVPVEAALRERHHADDAVHRGADLVRHTREEGRLGAALLLGGCETLFAVLDAVVQRGDVAEAQQIEAPIGRALDEKAHPLSAAQL